jgi:hypothetical protein
MQRKSIVLFMACLLMLPTPSFAAVGLKMDNTSFGTATDLTFHGAGSSSVRRPIDSNGSFNLILAGTGTSGAVSMTTAQYDVLPGYTYVRKAIAADAAYNNGIMANGTPGQLLTIFITARSGSGSFVLTPTTKTGFSSVTFDAVGDMATFFYTDDTNGWFLVSHTAATVTQVP